MTRCGIGWRAAAAAAALAAAGLLGAPLLTGGVDSTAFAQDGRSTGRDDGSTLGFIKIKDIDGESKEPGRDSWIDVLSIDWGVKDPGGGILAQRRSRRPAADIVVTLEYEEAAARLLQSHLQRAVISSLEIEQTATYGGARATYLRYELKNVQVTSYSVTGGAAGEPLVVTISFVYEEIEWTYTKRDATGDPLGTVQAEFRNRTRRR